MENPSVTFSYMYIRLIGPYSHDLSVFDRLTGSIYLQAMEMCYSAVVSSCCVFCRVLVLFAGCLFGCVVPLSRLRDRTSFGYCDRGIRLAMAVMPSVTRPLAFRLTP
jgi:hypothetical protein